MSKETKITFSKEIDSRITGVALIAATISIGTIISLRPEWFGDNKITTILQWIFIAFGVFGMIGELCSKKGRENKGTIIGLDDVAVGIFLILIWAAALYFFHNWIVNTVLLIILLIGGFGFFQGVGKVVYSFARLNQQNKMQNRREVKAAALEFLTKLFGIVLVVLQIVKAIEELKIPMVRP